MLYQGKERIAMLYGNIALARYIVGNELSVVNVVSSFGQHGGNSEIVAKMHIKYMHTSVFSGVIVVIVDCYLLLL